MEKPLFLENVEFSVSHELGSTPCQPEIEDGGTLRRILLSHTPRSCFFDLDGTLIGPSGKLTDRMTQALSQVRNSGLNTSIATGRPYFAVKEIIEAFGPTSVSMFYAGALVIEPMNERIVAAHHLSHAQTNGLLSFAKENKWYTELYDLHGYFTEEDSPYAEAHFHYLQKYPSRVELAQIAKEKEILKVGFILPVEHAQEAQRSFESNFPDLAFTSAAGAAHSNIMFINATSRDASRQSAFHALITHLELQAEEVFAFGDGEADKTFLRLAGCGVAMEDGSPLAKEAANVLALSVEDDGVALVLESLTRMLKS